MSPKLRFVCLLPSSFIPFALPVPGGNAYPDFVCELTDGRFLAVEYKGRDRFTAEDAELKRAVGAVWERRSQGRCLFVMPTNQDYPAIARKIRYAP